MLVDAVESIRSAGFEPGKDVALAVDVASSHFYRRRLVPPRPAEPLDSLGDDGGGWRSGSNRYPIVSVEDGLAEDDWAHWPALLEAIGGTALRAGRRLPLHQPPPDPPGDRGELRVRAAAEGEPDRHADRGGRGAAAGPAGRLAA